MTDAVDADTATATNTTTATTSSGISMGQVRKTIATSMEDTDSFSASLATLEPFLVKEAGATSYQKSMKRIARKAKQIGVSVPVGYAKEAAATNQRRAKQNAFIATKEEEKAAAKAAAAAEAAAAEPIEDELALCTGGHFSGIRCCVWWWWIGDHLF